MAASRELSAKLQTVSDRNIVLLEQKEVDLTRAMENSVELEKDKDDLKNQLTAQSIKLDYRGMRLEELEKKIRDMMQTSFKDTSLAQVIIMNGISHMFLYSLVCPLRVQGGRNPMFGEESVEEKL